MESRSYKNFYQEYYESLNDLKTNIKSIIKNTFNTMDNNREYVQKVSLKRWNLRDIVLMKLHL